MKRSISLFICLAVFVSAAFAKPKSTPIPAAPAFKGPKIQFLHMNYDFGDRMEGPVVTHIYRLKNIGSETLKVTNVHTDCGCTAAILEGDTLPPGQSRALKVTFNTQGRPGRSTKGVHMETNDPTAPRPTVQFTINVTREIDITPERAYFYQVRRGMSRSMTITVLALKGKPLTILSAESRQKKVVTTLAPLSLDGREGGTVVVTIPADAPLGDFLDEVVLKTTDPKRPEIVLPVQGDVIGRVQVNQKSVDFGTGGQPVTLTLNVDKPWGFSVRSVSTENHIVKPSIQKHRLDDGRELYQVVVAPPNPNRIPAGPYTDTLHLITNDPEQGDISIPVSGTKN